MKYRAFLFFMSAHVCLLLSLSFHTVCHFTMLPRSSFFHAKHICSSFLISVSAALMCNMFSDSNKRNVYNISNNCVCKYHACLYCPIMFLNSITNFCFTIIHFFLNIHVAWATVDTTTCTACLIQHDRDMHWSWHVPFTASYFNFQNSTKLFWTLV